MIEFFLETMRKSPEHEAVVADSLRITYGELLQEIASLEAWIEKENIPAGAVVSFNGDYSASAIALFMALANNHNIVVPLSNDSRAHFDEFRAIAQTEYDISLDDGECVAHKTGRDANHEHYQALREVRHPGLVLFSSGSTGKSKGIVQDLSLLMRKFKTPRKSLRMLIFLQLDHIGGVNSLLFALANKGTVIVANDRSPESVCEAIQNHRAQVLPTSPTFLNLLLLSGIHTRYDLSSLTLITYGTEPMQQSTLARLNDVFPNTQFQQTYGLSEVGILRSKSKDPGSLWVKVGGQEFDVKVVDGTLRIRSESAMLGYLNAPSPFDEEGFMDTEDLVEQQGEWIRILGRKSEIINVGGAKVFPAEVESTLLEMHEVEDAVVYGESHPITGKIVVAKIKPTGAMTPREMKLRVRQFCTDKMNSYKVPSKILLTEDTTYNERFKRMRRDVK
ncbi:fatty acid--CoA ligase family protein [Alteromonas sp. ASW11-19]|uniref:Fatty acid--CoA ligase family protein n=1 Tax=Alteromonas salexigens TaxID=2982530 RepID=A0ABT2VSG5_9ALTE|nr:fatty acid--CoA ligase family protein [Alteromonas salexigens]MCU7555373.1 fatty acid--CoA ligase family protein [Alteromonas salexigens]